MRIHHLNTISFCPLGGRLMDGHSEGLRAKLACRSVLVETEAGLVLIDTGYGLLDALSPTRRLSRFVLKLLEPELLVESTALHQIEARGFSARDVRHIVLTHLDCDHAGGLDDFPEASVHMMRAEAEDASKQLSWLDRLRYRPRQWSSIDRWQTYEAGEGEPWFRFEAVRDLRGVPPEILLVPLRGHTLGHAGVAVRDQRGWLLVAGDAYFWQDELDLERPQCPPGLRAYQWLMEKDRRARLANQRHLRELLRDHRSEVRIVCSHDPRELERESDRAFEPAPRRPVETRQLHIVT